MQRGGYRHGKKSGAPAPPVPKPRYIEDRLEALEKAFTGLLDLFGRKLDREHEDTQHELDQLLLKKIHYRAEKKKSILKRTLKKPIKRKRPTVRK